MSEEYAKVKAAVRASFEAYFTTESIAFLTENNDDFDKPDDAAYVRIFLNPGGSKTECIGRTKIYRQVFVAQIQVFVPMGSDETVGELIVSKVREEYTYKIVSASGVHAEFLESSSIVVGRDKGMYQENANLPFEVEFRKTT